MERENPTSIDTESKTDSRYNGWTNYETWAVKLWIDNDQGTQEYWLEQAKRLAGQDIEDDGSSTMEDDAVSALAELLETEHADQADEIIGPNGNAGVFSDLLRASLGSVNWREIAANLLEEYAEILA